MKTEWEYLVAELNTMTPELLTDELNRLGKEGWELAACIEDLGIFKKSIKFQFLPPSSPL